MTPLNHRSLEDSIPESAHSAAPLRVDVLKKRADFLRASRAPRAVTPGFILQMRRQATSDSGGVRVGFTCSKKVGNAVSRNRAKRRLRALAMRVLPQRGIPGADYVLIGRFGSTATRPFAQMQSDLEQALKKLAGQGA